MNLLPYDGEVYYFGTIFSVAQQKKYFDELMHHILWEQDAAIIYGKHIITKRKVAWYGNKHHAYTYSGVQKKAHLWNDVLLELKEQVQSITKAEFNACLLNLYHNGSESMSWHHDAEKELVENGTIASLSFGAPRRFCFKHKTSKEVREILLENGSLLIMKGKTQTYWQHALPKMLKVKTPRINLTFRQMKDL